VWSLLRSSIRGHTLRLILTGVAVVVGVAFLVATLLLSASMDRSLDQIGSEQVSRVALVRAPLPFDVDDAPGGSFGLLAARPGLPEGLVDDAGAVVGVRRAAGVATAPVVLTGVRVPFGDAEVPAVATTWIGDPELDGATLAEGRPPVSSDEVVLGATDAASYDLELGSVVTVAFRDGARELEVVGLTSPTTDVVLGLGTALGTPPSANRMLGAPPGQVDQIRVAAEDGVDQEELIRRLEVDLGEDVEVVPGDELVQAIRDLLQLLVSFATGFFVVFAGIALFVGGFIIFNTFSILLARRGREIGLLRAIGAGRRQVLAALFAEGLLTGLVASAVGVAVGAGLFLVVKVGAAVLADADLALVLRPSLLLAALAGTVVTTVAAVAPARRAASIAPIAALRESAVDVDVRPGRRALLGGAELTAGAGFVAWALVADPPHRLGVLGVGLALAFVGVTTLGPLVAGPFASLVGRPIERTTGVTGRLARANAVRNPRRTAATAAALMVGVTLVVVVATFAESLKATSNQDITTAYRADLIVSGGTTLGLPPDAVAAIEATDGVGVAVTLTATSTGIDGEVRVVVGADPAALTEVVDSDVVAGDLATVGDGQVALHERLAEDLGIGVGDSVRLDLPTGPRDLQLVVVYAVDDVLGDALVTPATFAAAVAPEDLVVRQVLVTGADGDTAGLQTRLGDAVVGVPQVDVTTPREQADAIAGIIDIALVVVYGLLALSVVIALLGIANSLALSVFERRHEIGLLRAVGMHTRQTARTVRWEAVVVALFGTVQGSVLGLAVGMAVVASQPDVVLALPWPTVAVAFVVAVAAGVLAAVFPAWRAGRTDIVRALGAQ
jgi:putative ABC transport system permease protein